MIKKTFTDYNPGKFNIKNFSLDDYIKVIEEYNFCSNWGEHLDNNPNNILNISNMPWFDLGELPYSYNMEKDEVD